MFSRPEVKLTVLESCECVCMCVCVCVYRRYLFLRVRSLDNEAITLDLRRAFQERSQCKQVRLHLWFTGSFIKSLTGGKSDWVNYSGVKGLVRRSGLEDVAPGDLVLIQG